MTEGIDLFSFFGVLLSHLDDRRGILGERQGITTLPDEGFGGLFCLVRTVPCVDPSHVDLCLGVYGFDAKGKCVDVANDLRNRKRPHISDFVGLGQSTRHQTVQVIGLIQISKIGADILRPFESGAVHKVFVRISHARLDGVVHIAETGGKYHIALLFLDEPIDHPCGIGFGHIFHKDGFQPWQLF